MNDGWAALLFRPEEVSDDVLALGFAIALAGYDIERPRLDVAPLDGLPGWSVAFYASGIRAPGHGPGDEVAHQRELFTGEGVTPAIGVRLAARRPGAPDVTVHSFVHWPAHGVDVGESFAGAEEDEPLDEPLPVGTEDEVNLEGTDDEDDEDEEDDEDPRVEGEPASGRLAAIFGRPVLGDLARALFLADRSLVPRLAPVDADGIAAMTRRLVAALGRVAGRGAAPPRTVAGMAPPETYRSFVAAYDFEDPTDPRDLYRELAIGRIRGTLRFFRPEEEAPAGVAAVPAYPVAELLSSHLSDPRRVATLALHADGVRLALVSDGGAASEAGPTFGELLHYLALGFSPRSALEEETIAALMLRAAVRVA